jgi:small-conductance mechanosensitive channel
VGDDEFAELVESSNSPAAKRIAELERELEQEREQVTILRSDEKRLMQFAKTYRLRADEAEAKLASERALSNEMAAQLEHASFAYDPGGCQKMFEAWKDAREP